MEYEVIWNGGPLLPERLEGTSPIWRNMVDDVWASRLYSLLNRVEASAVRTRRLCACGCGEEMVYKRWTATRDMGRYRRGHARRRAA